MDSPERVVSGARRIGNPVVAGVLALCLAATCASCSDGGSRPTASDAPSTPGYSSPTPSPTSQEFENAEPCPPADEAELTGAGCVSWADADFDGDGSSERFLVYAGLDSEGMPTEWFAAVRTAGGLSPPIEVRRGPGIDYVYPRVFAVEDASGDGRPEVFVKVSAILYHVGGQQILGLFAVRDGGVVHVEFPDGRPVIVPIGGISGYGDGVRCAEVEGEPGLLIRHIRRVGVPPKKYRWSERAYVWEGLALRLASITHGDVPIEATLYDPRVRPYYEFRCGDSQQL